MSGVVVVVEVEVVVVMVVVVVVVVMVVVGVVVVYQTALRPASVCRVGIVRSSIGYTTISIR